MLFNFHSTVVEKVIKCMHKLHIVHLFKLSVPHVHQLVEELSNIIHTDV